MKKLLLTAVAASTLFAVPANAADYGRQDQRSGHQLQQRGNDRNGNRAYQQVRANQAHRWARGQRFDRRYATNYQVISNYRAYHLQAPPRGYRYVRANNDILLVAITSGLISAVFGNQL